MEKGESPGYPQPCEHRSWLFLAIHCRAGRSCLLQWLAVQSDAYLL